MSFSTRGEPVGDERRPVVDEPFDKSEWANSILTEADVAYIKKVLKAADKQA